MKKKEVQASESAGRSARSKRYRGKQVSRDVLKGLLFIAVVLSVKFIIERSTFGKHLQLMSYNLLQTQLSSQPLPITVVDISDLPPKDFTVDGETVTATPREPLREMINVSTSSELRSLKGHFEIVTSVKFSADGKVLASGRHDYSVKLWDVSTGAELRTVKDYSYFVLNSIAFSPDGKLLAGAGSSGTVKLSTAPTGAELRTFKGHSAFVRAVVFSADGKTLASGSDDKTIKLWNVSTGAEFCTLEGHSAYVRSVVFSPDGKTLASSSWDNTMRLWDVSRCTELFTLKGHSLPVASVAFSLDNKYLVSGSDDNSIKVWEVSSGKELASLIALDEYDWIVVTPDGLFDGTAPAWKKLLWRFDNNTFNHAPVEAYFNDFFHPGLLQEIFRGERPLPPEGKELAKRDRRRPTVTSEQVKSSAASPATVGQGSSVPNDRRVTIRVGVTENIEPVDASQARSGGAQDVRLFRNGSLVKLWRGDAFDQQSGCVQADIKDGTNGVTAGAAVPRKAVCTATVPIVAGDNEFTAYAFNHDSLKSDDAQPLQIKGDKSLERKGTLYVLAIGINNYKDEKYNLKFAVADVDEIGKEIKAQEDRLGIYSRTEIISLTDDQATESIIKHALRRFADGERVGVPEGASLKLRQELEKIKDIQPEDALVIYYAGHGTARGEHFYLLPQGFIALDEERLRASSISDIELNEVLERVDASNLLMVIDACQSGQALGGEKEGRGPMNSKGLAQLAYDKGMYILTAAQSYQAAKEVSRSLTGRDIKHGLLTFALLEGLSKAKRDNEGRISEREWMNYAVEQVPLMQMEEMKKRNAEIKRGGTGERSPQLLFKPGDNAKADPQKRNVQRPRVFYRRELESHPLIVAKQ